MKAARDLNEFRRYINIIARIMYCLATTVSRIILVPAVTGHTFVLFACVAEIYEYPRISIQYLLRDLKTDLSMLSMRLYCVSPRTVLYSRIVIHFRPK